LRPACVFILSFFKNRTTKPVLAHIADGVKRICLLSLAALVLFAAAEILYRLYWASRCALASCGDSGENFSFYILGESTATGEPYREIGLSSLILNSFGDRIQGRTVRVFPLAQQGESIYPQAMALERALRCRNKDNPGAVIVYSGNNDATHAVGVPVFERFREHVLSASMFLTDAGFLAEKLFPVFRIRTLDTYEHYLRHTVEISLKSGLIPILATVVSNISDIDPLLPPDPGHNRAEMRAILVKGMDLEEKRRTKEAILYYAGHFSTHPRMLSYLKYRTAKCYQALGQYGAARQYYNEVVDAAEADNFGRATSRQNNFIRRLAKQYSTPMVDAVKIFEERSPHNIVGDSLFSDGHHPNMSGYLLLANAYAGKISEVFNEPIRRSFSGPEDIFRVFSYGPKRQAKALVSSGRWLLNSAADNAYPEKRLKMAKARFENALEFDPHDFSAWLSLGLSEAGLNGGLFSDNVNLEWLSHYGLFSYEEYNFPPAQLQEILAKLSACGVSRALIDKISLEAGK